MLLYSLAGIILMMLLRDKQREHTWPRLCHPRASPSTNTHTEASTCKHSYLPSPTNFGAQDQVHGDCSPGYLSSEDQGLATRLRMQSVEREHGARTQQGHGVMPAAAGRTTCALSGHPSSCSTQHAVQLNYRGILIRHGVSRGMR